jgi:hypothetical protein
MCPSLPFVRFSFQLQKKMSQLSTKTTTTALSAVLGGVAMLGFGAWMYRRWKDNSTNKAAVKNMSEAEIKALPVAQPVKSAPPGELKVVPLAEAHLDELNDICEAAFNTLTKSHGLEEEFPVGISLPKLIYQHYLHDKSKVVGAAGSSPCRAVLPEFRFSSLVPSRALGAYPVVALLDGKVVGSNCASSPDGASAGPSLVRYGSPCIPSPDPVLPGPHA